MQEEPVWPEIRSEQKPWTRWWWLGSAVDEETLTELLVKYEEAGLGGVEITPIYGVRGEEDRFIDYLSPTWVEMLNHTTGVADSLQIGVDMATGTGWPFGGPGLASEHIAKKYHVRTYSLEEGNRLEPRVIHEDPITGNEAPLLAVMAYSPKGEVRDVTASVDTTTKQLQWTPPSGPWKLYAVFRVRHGKKVERSAPGGEGYVIDHFSEEALTHYLHRFDTALVERSEPWVRAYFNDSYEVGGANWTDDFFEEFHRRRGYDVRRHLPALLGEDSIPADTVARVKSDYRQTISDLLLEEFTVPWGDRARERGSLIRNQAHGSPGNLLDLYAAADIPETETFGASGFEIPGLRTDPRYPDPSRKPDPLVLKFASSAAHLTGKSLVSSESATWLGEHFKVALSQIKPEIDQLFISGINHVFYHGTPYSPPEARWPGWLFYASTHFAPTNTFWRDLPALNEYIARCQSFLQAGAPSSDVLLYFPMFDRWHEAEGELLSLTAHNPDEWLHGTPVHEAAHALRQRGYTFDYVSDRLLKRVGVENGELTAGGAVFDAVVVPPAEFMPVETLEKLRDLAEAGATIIVLGELPADVPGLHQLAERKRQFEELTTSIRSPDTSSAGIRDSDVGEGSFLIGGDLVRLVDHAGLKREPIADYEGVEFVRRRHDEGYVYFMTNLGSTPVDGWVALGRPAEAAALYDPLSGRTGRAAIRADRGEQTEVYLQLPPGESRLLQTFRTGTVGGAPWEYISAERERATRIEGPWEITFLDGGPELPSDISSDTLGSWTTLGGEAARSFSGTARYETTFTTERDADEWLLDLGTVAASAEVRVNGQLVETAWSHPFRLRLGDAVQLGENTLEVDVTNLMANRIAYLDRQGVDWKKFYDINFVNIDYQPFDASDWSPMPSGLLGPARVIPADVIQPAK